MQIITQDMRAKIRVGGLWGHTPGILLKPLEHPVGDVVAQRVRRNHQVRLIFVKATPEAPMAGDVRQELGPTAE